jgi:hypothetical protein
MERSFGEHGRRLVALTRVTTLAAILSPGAAVAPEHNA